MPAAAGSALRRLPAVPLPGRGQWISVRQRPPRKIRGDRASGVGPKSDLQADPAEKAALPGNNCIRKAVQASHEPERPCHLAKSKPNTW